MSINRFSSQRGNLDRHFLADRLRGARSYKRIAGYFRSSILDLVGDEIEGVAKVQIVCNSDLDPVDIQVARRAESALLERWNRDLSLETESIFNQPRYRKLFDLLKSGRVEVRVVPRDTVFVHGKAGVIELADGAKTAFLGSANETLNAFVHNYELVWEDSSPDAVTWVEEEFEALWTKGIALPNAVIEEIGRVANREEVSVDVALAAGEVAASALVESPIYRGGEMLQPWQRAFVTHFMDCKETYGKARILLADEVGLGKTLSLAASALVSVLQGDGPVLILCPATLTLQWQVELNDKLGIPSLVWLTNRKEWLDPNGHVIKTRGAEDVANCPYQIAIVSAGLATQEGKECEALLQRKFGTVILDEAHRARSRGGLGAKKDQPNNLLAFMMKIAGRTKNLLLGTATPIQTEVRDLWDLMKLLNSGADFVLGREYASRWMDPDDALPLIKGEGSVSSDSEAWDWLRSPLPPGKENTALAALRMQLRLGNQEFFCEKPFSELPFSCKILVKQTAFQPQFFKTHNPILRNTVLRQRHTLEEAGLLDKIGVEVHPSPTAPRGTYREVNFEGLGLLTNNPFNVAYVAAERFASMQAGQTAFLKTLFLQRICSSFASGISTAKKLLADRVVDEDEDAITVPDLAAGGIDLLKTIIQELERPEARDPKLAAVQYFLDSHHVEGETWLEHGCIIFSQYFETASWIARELAKSHREEPLAVYAGAGKSLMLRGDVETKVNREEIKRCVKEREIRLIVATDAACEGLNLQTLGSLINIDLPWNPSRLEQRLGRIKRIGQARPTVDMLNLVYHDTQDEKVYQAISRRLQDKFDIFGGLPDIIEDDWIEDVEKLDEQLEDYLSRRNQTRNSFEIRYEETLDPDKNRWELCSKVLARRDIIAKLSQPW